MPGKVKKFERRGGMEAYHVVEDAAKVVLVWKDICLVW